MSRCGTLPRSHDLVRLDEPAGDRFRQVPVVLRVTAVRAAHVLAGWCYLDGYDEDAQPRRFHEDVFVRIAGLVILDAQRRPLPGQEDDREVFRPWQHNQDGPRDRGGTTW